MIENTPIALRVIPQWCAWAAIPRSNGKIGKPPIDIKTFKFASTDNPDTWSSYDEVIKWIEENKNGYIRTRDGNYQIKGIGIVLTSNIDIVGIDIDDAVNDNIIEPWALPCMKLVCKHKGYYELSPSSCGIHAFFKGKLTSDWNRKGKIELYNEKRFLTVTGHTFSFNDKGEIDVSNI